MSRVCLRCSLRFPDGKQDCISLQRLMRMMMMHQDLDGVLTVLFTRMMILSSRMHVSVLPQH